MPRLLVVCTLLASLAAQELPHVVFLIGESEYGSQATMPAFARRLEQELGLRVSVLQSRRQELPALDVLDDADLLVLFLRFRRATTGQFDRLRAWFDAGKPCVALRTTSHAFVADKGWFPPLFGGHYKSHAPNGQGTISQVLPSAAGHPILRGIAPTVEMGHGGTYNAQPLADTATPLLLGRTGELPCEPIAWTNRYRPESRIFYTSLGSRENFERADFQTLLGNAVLWCLQRDVPAGGAFGAGTQREPFAVDEVPSAPPLAAPADAVVLFDGTSNSQWRHWDPSVEPLAIGIDARADSSRGGENYDQARWRVDGRAMVARPGFGDVVSRQAYGDYHLHLDFFVPPAPAWMPGAFRGRSGVYLAGRYEIEISDDDDCGAIFGQVPPSQPAARGAGSWQSLDVHFRHEQDRLPMLSAWLNGLQIHDRVELSERTVYGFRAEPPGSRSLAKGGGVRFARAAGESFAFGGGEYAIAVRFRTKSNGTLASKSPPSGPWQPNAKALFLRDGRLVYDIGWVGMMASERRYDDGQWHRVVLTHAEDEALLIVDGEQVAAREHFVAEDEPEHVFKIGAASPDFGGVYGGEISDVLVFEREVAADKAVQWTRNETVHLGTPVLTWQPEEPSNEPQVAPQRVVVAAPIRLQADSSPVRFANVWVRSLAAVDHRGLVRAADPAAGAAIFGRTCARCHRGEQAGFARGLPDGSDPLSIYRSLADGAEHHEPIAWLPPAARHDVAAYLRREWRLPGVDAAYLAQLPVGMSAAARSTPAKRGEWPAYRRMDYGNALHWTYEVAADNIAQKGLAVRLDAGEGGVSEGRAFLVYDLDTMRVAAAFSGAGFLDWRGVAFDGSHNSHASIVGDVAFVNPVGPGWANPNTGSFADERLVGRDGRRYGPLARDWVRYRGRAQHGAATAIDYTVGSTSVREQPAVTWIYGTPVFERVLSVGPRRRLQAMRVAPVDERIAVQVDGDDGARLVQRDGFYVVDLPAGERQMVLRVSVLVGRRELLALRDSSEPVLAAGPPPLEAVVVTRLRRGEPEGAFAVDELRLPPAETTASRSLMRLGGVDFFADGRRAAVSTWNGDVWIVDGIGEHMAELRWQRVAAGLHQPLGVKIVDGVIHVACRDQICALEDRDGDGTLDYYRCVNSDHQVTEHFHEFAMGLQTDADGNFYYAKSARHAKPALVPHHGTLLKVTADGSRTEIVANGFRAANGICVNGDGTFYVTDQEGHWTPKNRINRVVPGGFYGNMMGYHDGVSAKDEHMQPPLCWITNAFDRSPGELVRVQGEKWGLPERSLLQLSYGMGLIFLVLEDKIGDAHQGAMVALPIDAFPTGVMRGRFHPATGQLYCCGLFGWSAARTRPGGLYRVRYVGGAVGVPIAMRSIAGGIELQFDVPLQRELAEDPDSYACRVWSLRRSKRYGSEHHDERDLTVGGARLLDDGKTVQLSIAELQPTMGLEIRCDLESTAGRVLRPVLHGTLHVVR